MKKSYAKSLALCAVLGIAAISTQAQAATVSNCGGTATKIDVNGGSGATTASTTGFFRQGFAVQCSNNVLLSHDETSTNGPLVVGAGSIKGNQYFGGNSNGGAIVPKGKCTGTNDACVAADVVSAITASSS